jgi:outer membrane protein assembly factor BamD (BamD/ComL family)
MTSQTNLAPPLFLAFALAGASLWADTDRCRSGVCLKIRRASAQQGVGRGPVSAPRDPELEKTSLHNLEVARYYFKRKPDKADKQNSLERLNKAVESRLLEILDTQPDFSKVDEVYYLLGEVYYRWEQPEKAAEFLGKVVKEFPDSEFFQGAKKRLEELQAKKGPKKEG